MKNGRKTVHSPLNVVHSPLNVRQPGIRGDQVQRQLHADEGAEQRQRRWHRLVGIGGNGLLGKQDVEIPIFIITPVCPARIGPGPGTPRIPS